MRVQRLECPVKHYDWGERAAGGVNPYIAQLLGKAPGDEPWAELWIGAHPEGSSKILPGGEKLCDLIAENPGETLGGLAETADTLPFLLKILCCSKPLSIQSHPDIETAGRLHLEMQEQFPDGNHKPEVLLAVSDFRMMAGFRPLEDILGDLESMPSLRPWLEGAGENPTVKSLCSFILRSDAALLEEMGRGCGGKGANAEFFRELCRLYPGDCGCFFALMLNYFTIKPGQAVFVKPNMPHAYVCGEGVECMANSNNVIRAGLTPKYVAKELLLETLDFSSVRPEELVLSSDAAGNFSYECGVDFGLKVMKLGVGESSGAVAGPAVVLLLSGKAAAAGMEFGAGETVFIPGTAAGTEITGTAENTVAVAAYAPEK